MVEIFSGNIFKTQFRTELSLISGDFSCKEVTGVYWRNFVDIQLHWQKACFESGAPLDLRTIALL